MSMNWCGKPGSNRHEHKLTGFLVKDASDDLASLLATLEVPGVCQFRHSRILPRPLGANY